LLLAKTFYSDQRSILSLAALQRFNADRSCTRWYSRAVAHQQAAISRVKPHLQGLEDETCTWTCHKKAILAFSTFTSLYAVAEPFACRPRSLGCGGGAAATEFDAMAEFIRVIQIGRSTLVFVQRHLHGLITTDPFMASKYSSRQPTYAGDLEVRFPQLGLLLGYIIQFTEDKDEHRAVFLYAARLVFEYMAVFLDSIQGEGETQTQVIFAWATGVDNLFWDLCEARHPVALVILAHFALLMSLSRGVWFTQRWPQLLVKDIREKLDGCGDIMRWPVDMVLRNGVDGV
jgi:hypothetical protein